jgi:hypothetical protein
MKFWDLKVNMVKSGTWKYTVLCRPSPNNIQILVPNSFQMKTYDIWLWTIQLTEITLPLILNNLWFYWVYWNCSAECNSFVLTSIYPPAPHICPTYFHNQNIIVFPTKNERDPPLFTGKLLIKFQNILRNTTQVIIRHRVKILFSIISSPITLEWQKWKSSKMKGILLPSPVNSW